MLKKFLFSGLFPNILLIVLGLTPLLPAQNQFGYEYPKVLFFICAMLFMLFLFEFSPQQIRQKFFSWSFLSLYGILFLTSLLISSVLQPHVVQSLFGTYPYYQGILLYVFLLLLALLVSAVPVSLRMYSYAIVTSACGVALVAIGQWVGIHILNMHIATYAGRVVSTFGQPNLYSGYLVMVLPFFIFLLEKTSGKRKMFLIVATILVLFGIVASTSRLAYGMTLFIGVSCAIFYLRKSKFFKKILIGLCLVVVALGIIILPKIIQSEFIDPFDNYWLARNNPEKRVFIWQVALLQGLKSPMLGYGVDSFRSVYSSYFNDAVKDKTYESRKVLVVDRAHNYVLDLFIYSGIFGILLWTLLVKNMFVRLRHQRLLFLALMLYVIFVMIQPQSIVHLIYFWFLAGLSTKPEIYLKGKK